MSGPVVAVGAGPGGGRAGCIDHSELALVASLVLRDQPLDDLAGAQALAQEREPVRAVARVCVRLRRDSPHLRLGPRDDEADGEELGLDGYSPLLRLEIAGRDRERRDDRVSHT